MVTCRNNAGAAQTTTAIVPQGQTVMIHSCDNYNLYRWFTFNSSGTLTCGAGHINGVGNGVSVLDQDDNNRQVPWYVYGIY